jgi:hypothetical protein
MARILDQAGTALTLTRDQYSHGDADARDYDGFVEPSFSDIGDQVSVTLLIREGLDWFIGTSHRVVSLDRVTDTITLDTAPPVTNEYADRFLILSTFTAQSPGEYPRTIFGAIVRDDLTHGAANVVGRPFSA